MWSNSVSYCTVLTLLLVRQDDTMPAWRREVRCRSWTKGNSRPRWAREGRRETSSHHSERRTFHTYELFISGTFHLIFLDHS